MSTQFLQKEISSVWISLLSDLNVRLIHPSLEKNAEGVNFTPSEFQISVTRTRWVDIVEPGADPGP